MKSYLNSKLYLFEKLIKKDGNAITDSTISERKKIEKIALKKSINLNLILDKKKGIKLISHKFYRRKTKVKNFNW